MTIKEDQEREAQQKRERDAQAQNDVSSGIMSMLGGLFSFWPMLILGIGALWAAGSGLLGDDVKDTILDGWEAIKNGHGWTMAKALFGDADAIDEMVELSTAKQARGKIAGKIVDQGIDRDSAASIADLIAHNDATWATNRPLFKNAQGHYGDLDGTVLANILVKNPALASKLFAAMKPAAGGDGKANPKLIAYARDIVGNTAAMQLLVSNPDAIRVLAHATVGMMPTLGLSEDALVQIITSQGRKPDGSLNPAFQQTLTAMLTPGTDGQLPNPLAVVQGQVTAAATPTATTAGSTTAAAAPAPAFDPIEIAMGIIKTKRDESVAAGSPDAVNLNFLLTHDAATRTLISNITRGGTDLMAINPLKDALTNAGGPDTALLTDLMMQAKYAKPVKAFADAVAPDLNQLPAGSVREGLTKLSATPPRVIDAITDIRSRGVLPFVLISKAVNHTDPQTGFPILTGGADAINTQGIRDMLLDPRNLVRKAGLDNIATVLEYATKQNPAMIRQNLTALVGFSETVHAAGSNTGANLGRTQQIMDAMLQVVIHHNLDALKALPADRITGFFGQEKNSQAFLTLLKGIDARSLPPEQQKQLKAIVDHWGVLHVDPKTQKLDSALSSGVAELLADPKAMAIILGQMKEPPKEKANGVLLNNELRVGGWLDGALGGTWLGNKIGVLELGTLPENRQAVVDIMGMLGMLKPLEPKAQAKALMQSRFQGGTFG